jgi:hypothetical protein
MYIFAPPVNVADVAVYEYTPFTSVISFAAAASPVPLPSDIYALHEVTVDDGVYDTVNDVPLMSEMTILPFEPDSVTVPPEEPPPPVEEAVTVIVFIADFPPAEALITAVPAVFPVTMPLVLTEA